MKCLKAIFGKRVKRWSFFGCTPTTAHSVRVSLMDIDAPKTTVHTIELDHGDAQRMWYELGEALQKIDSDHGLHSEMAEALTKDGG